MPIIPELENGITFAKEVEDGRKRLAYRSPAELLQIQQIQHPDDVDQQWFVSVVPTTPTL